MPTRILSFDGAVAAALQIRLVLRYEQAYPGFLANTDVFAGVSNGALMALYLGQHRTQDHDKNLGVIQDAIDFSNAVIPIFQLRLWKLLRFATGWLPLHGSCTYAKTLAKYLDDTPLSQVSSNVLALSFGVKDWKPHIFTNMEPPSPPSPVYHGDVSIVEAAMASSAAPLALPLNREETPLGDRILVDGSLAATNPTLVAIAHTADWLHGGNGGTPIPEELEQLRVMSLGASFSQQARQRIVDGFVPKCLAFRDLSWGWIQWLPLRPLLLAQMLYQGQIDTVDYECRMLLPLQQYLRVNPAMNQIKSFLGLLLLPERCLIKELDKQADEIWSDPTFRGGVVTWLESAWS